jgi:AcrR family transcriptional regulator
MTTSSRADGPGLRERKKARTRAAIQQHALRLFLDQGYAETTVDQIAAAAEVSQSTFFRYFATKEETVLYDKLDPVMMEAFVNQPADMPPLAAVRAALSQVFDQLPTDESELEMSRMRLISSVPELRAVVLDQFVKGLTMLGEALAERLGRRTDDFAIQVWSGAVLGVAFASFLANDRQDLTEALERGFTLLEKGLPLD